MITINDNCRMSITTFSVEIQQIFFVLSPDFRVVNLFTYRRHLAISSRIFISTAMLSRGLFLIKVSKPLIPILKSNFQHFKWSTIATVKI